MAGILQALEGKVVTMSVSVEDYAEQARHPHHRMGGEVGEA